MLRLKKKEIIIEVTNSAEIVGFLILKNTEKPKMGFPGRQNRSTHVFGLGRTSWALLSVSVWRTLGR